MVDRDRLVNTLPWKTMWHTFENTEKLQQLTSRNAELIQAAERLTREVPAATVGRPTTDGPAAAAPSGETDAR